jgi:hypothetical protein
MSSIRAIAITPSSNRSRAGQSKIYLAPRRLLRLLHEGSHYHDALDGGSHIERPSDTTAAFQTHLPKTAFNLLDVRLTHLFQAVLLDEPRDASQPRLHIFRQTFDLPVHNSIESLDRPAQLPLYQKRYVLDESATPPCHNGRAKDHAI